MIVCVCYAVSDRDVDRAIRDGARTPAAVGAACRAGTDCGSCHLALMQRIQRLERRPAEAPRDLAVLALTPQVA